MNEDSLHEIALQLKRIADSLERGEKAEMMFADGDRQTWVEPVELGPLTPGRPADAWPENGPPMPEG